MDYLNVRTSDGRSIRHDLRGDRVRIGRSQENDLPLPDPYISSFHAVIVRRDGGWVVEDLGGLNGTSLNGRRIESPAPVAPGDRIRLGRTVVCLNGELSTPVPIVDRDPIDEAEAISLPVDLVTPGLTPVPDASSPTAGGPRISGVGATLPAAAVRIILEADRELVFHRPLGEILEKIMDLVHRGVPFERGVLILKQGDRLVTRVRRVPAEADDMPFTISGTIARRVLDHKEAVLASDALTDKRFSEGHSVQGQHIRSLLCVPLWNQKDVIGFIYVDNPREPGRFRTEDLHLITHLAAVAAVKIEEHHLFEEAVAARAMVEELHHASEIQRHLLPAVPPAITGYRLAGSSVPCRAVGGDTYDFLPIPDGRWIVSLGDVSGKGLPAALLMCLFQASLRASAPLDLPPEEIMARLNRLIHPQVPPNRFVTFFLGVLDPEAHTLAFVNAGHDPPLILSAGTVAARLEASGPPVGMFPDARYATSSIALRPGDVLFCCSDGVPDARNAAGEAFGTDRAGARAASMKGAGPDEILRGVIDALEGHCGGAPQDDDITMIAMQRTE